MDIEKLESLIKSLVQQFINREYPSFKDDKDIFWVIILDTYQDLEQMGINTAPVAHILADFRKSQESQTIAALYGDLPHGHQIYVNLIFGAAKFLGEQE